MNTPPEVTEITACTRFLIASRRVLRDMTADPEYDVEEYDRTLDQIDQELNTLLEIVEPHTLNL